MKKWFGLVVVLFTFYLSSTVAEGLVPVLDPALGSAAERISTQFQRRIVNYLNELPGRRRLTTVVPNEQSPFYGVQMNYVNVHRGNLTFAVRDLVRLDGIPIVFGRVYDSSKLDGSDFGPGWKLSVSESIARVENHLIYTDANNSHYQLNVAGNQIRSQHPHLTGIASGHFDGNRLQLLSNGLTKIFQRNGDIPPVADSDGWRYYEYDRAGRVNGVSINDDLTVAIRTDGFGRVFGDGTGSTLQGLWGWNNHEDLRFTHSYSSPGVYTMVVDVSRSSNASIYLAQASEEIGGQSSYTPPPNASAPAFDYVPLVRNGADFGDTSIEYDDASLVCTAIGDGKFRLEGDISVKSSSFINISNELPSIGMCSGTPRTPGNISHTEAHELVHANALVGVINDHKTQIGMEYSSRSSCESTLATLRTSLAADFASEEMRQENHLDHAGERRHAAVCPTPGGDTMEVVCGLDGWECQPGNRYPGR